MKPTFLIVKLSSLGDILQSLQAISFIREICPESKIDWVVEQPFASVVSSHPYIHQIYAVDVKNWRKNLFQSRFKIWRFVRQLREKKYDYVIDLQGNCKSGLINLLAKSNRKCGFGPLSVSEWPNLLTTLFHYEVEESLPMPAQYQSLIEQLLGKTKVQTKIPFFSLTFKEHNQIKHFHEKAKGLIFMVCFGSKWENKRLSKETLLEFLQGVQKQLLVTFLFIYSKREEKEEALWLQSQLKGEILGDLSIPMWQGHMRLVDLVISMDSSSLHLAGISSIPTFSFFGPSKPEIYCPEGNFHGFFRGKCPYQISFDKRCPKLRTCTTGACLKNASASSILYEFFSWWNTVSSKSKSI